MNARARPRCAHCGTVVDLFQPACDCHRFPCVDGVCMVRNLLDPRSSSCAKHGCTFHRPTPTLLSQTGEAP